MHLPRIMLAAPASGSGKTLITCGLLQALVDRGIKTASFKCGPDYIDPMFHSRVIGTPSRNLDPWFVSEETLRYLFARQAEKVSLSVMEGVMGFYDGITGMETKGSSYDLARVTETPVILVVNTRGMGLSVLPLIKGFLEYRADSNIRGVILNQMSPSLYPEVKAKIEAELGIRALGYVPKVSDCVIESRHLGLVTPDEITDLKERLKKLAGVLSETLDLEGILALAEKAPDLSGECPEKLKEQIKGRETSPVRIAVAKDEAFCFYYEDNLDLLRELGAELVFVSPRTDECLPTVDGLLIGGGYPELYAKDLSANKSFLSSLQEAREAGMPILAECGGFMYLQKTMEDMNRTAHPMAGLLNGDVVKTDRLGRFGYIELTSNVDSILGPAGTTIRAHEFHYFDCSENGSAFHAQKPLRKRGWECMVAEENLAAGFPHLYYYSAPEVAARFVDACRRFETTKKNK